MQKNEVKPKVGDILNILQIPKEQTLDDENVEQVWQEIEKARREGLKDE